MINDQSPNSIEKIEKFKIKEIYEPGNFSHLLYTFANGDYLLEGLQYSKDMKVKYEIREPNNPKPKLEFGVDNFKSNYAVKDFLFLKYDEYIDIYEFINNNTSYRIKQTIIIDPIKPSMSYNGYFMKVIDHQEKISDGNKNIINIIDILIQPNRMLQNYYRIYRSINNGDFYFYKKLIINEGDEPGFIFVNENDNNLLSFVEKATNEKSKEKSSIIQFDLSNYEKLKHIMITDLKKFNSAYGFRQELKIYNNAFIYIHNRILKVFCLDDLKNNYFQIINSQNILNYQCSSISHIDKSLFIAQSDNMIGDKSFIKQYILDKENFELEEISSLEINGFIEDIYNSINGYIVKLINAYNEVKFFLLYK